jgi:hypothetical protein
MRPDFGSAIDAIEALRASCAVFSTMVRARPNMAFAIGPQWL